MNRTFKNVVGRLNVCLASSNSKFLCHNVLCHSEKNCTVKFKDGTSITYSKRYGKIKVSDPNNKNVRKIY
jgi:phage baseplate assembly protein gpV